MRPTAVMLAAVIFAVILGAWTPRTSSALVDARYGCATARFTNYSTEPVKVSHGVPRSAVVEELVLGPGESRVVQTNATNFRWWAEVAGTGRKLVGVRPGVDLTAPCRETNGRMLAADARSRPAGRPLGLPKTGHGLE